MFFEDSWGHRTGAPAVASVTLDSSPPEMSRVRLAKAGTRRASINVQWRGDARDAGAGLAGYMVACCASDGPPPESCEVDAGRGVGGLSVALKRRSVRFTVTPAMLAGPNNSSGNGTVGGNGTDTGGGNGTDTGGGNGTDSTGGNGTDGTGGNGTDSTGGNGTDGTGGNDTPSDGNGTLGDGNTTSDTNLSSAGGAGRASAATAASAKASSSHAIVTLHFRVCAVDALGNTAPGLAGSRTFKVKRGR